MTTVRGTADRSPAPALHRPAVGARIQRPGGRPASLVRAVRGRLGRQLLTFAAIGVVSTGAYAVLFLGLRSVTGASIANALALVLTAVVNTAANRRLTFGARRGHSIVRDQLAGLLALAVALAITTLSVGLLDALAPGAGRLAELATLVIANALATITRFVLLRSWIAADREPALVPVPSSSPQE